MSTVPQGRFSIYSISLLNPEKIQREETIFERVRLSVNTPELPDRWQRKVVRRVKKGSAVVPCAASLTHHESESERDVPGFLCAGPLTARSLTYRDHFHNPTSRPAAFPVLPSAGEGSEQ